MEKDSDFHHRGAEGAEVGKGFTKIPLFPLRTLRLGGEYSSLDPFGCGVAALGSYAGA
jgi:hypothetical protein